MLLQELQEENGCWSIKASRVNTSTPRRGESQSSTKFSNFNYYFVKLIWKKRKQQSGNNAQEISFERQHHRISYTDLKVRTTN